MDAEELERGGGDPSFPGSKSELGFYIHDIREDLKELSHKIDKLFQVMLIVAAIGGSEATEKVIRKVSEVTSRNRIEVVRSAQSEYKRTLDTREKRPSETESVN
jgi:hypothetical protein